jgi:hypothetical protein
MRAVLRRDLLAKGGMEWRMPLARYCSFVGGVLLALLFILDACFPKFPVAAKAKVYPPVIRIYSDRKWPERIVYDTSLPTIVPITIAAAEEIAPTLETIPEASDAKEREAFAMLPSSADRSQVAGARTQEPKPRHHSKIARKRAPAPRVVMARHQQFGWFERSFW